MSEERTPQSSEFQRLQKQVRQLKIGLVLAMIIPFLLIILGAKSASRI